MEEQEGTSRWDSQRPTRDEVIDRLSKLQLTLTSLLCPIDDDARLMDASLEDAHELAGNIHSSLKQRVFGSYGALSLPTYQRNYDAFEDARINENDMYEVYAEDLERYQKRQRKDLSVAESDSDKLAVVQRRRTYISALQDFHLQVSDILSCAKRIFSP